MSRCLDPDCGWCESTARNLAWASYPTVEDTWVSAIALIAWMHQHPDGQLLTKLMRETEDS